MVTPAAEQLLTSEEFERLRDPDGGRTELVDGRVVTAPLPGWAHGVHAGAVAWFVGSFVHAHSIGEVVVSSGYCLKRNPDTVRGPDVSFVATARMPVSGPPAGYFDGAPTLAVEVISQNNAERDVLVKVGEYLDAGAECVWLVRSSNKTVTVYFAGGEMATLHPGDTLDSSHAGFNVDGFALPIDEIFA